jgi:hypothetical protein
MADVHLMWRTRVAMANMQSMRQTRADAANVLLMRQTGADATNMQSMRQTGVDVTCSQCGRPESMRRMCSRCGGPERFWLAKNMFGYPRGHIGLVAVSGCDAASKSSMPSFLAPTTTTLVSVPLSHRYNQHTTQDKSEMNKKLL